MEALRAAGVVAGLQGDVSCASAQVRAGVLGGDFEGDNFGVVEQVVLVPAFAGNLARAIENDAAHCGVGRADGDAAAGKLESALHPISVLICPLIHVHGRREPSSVYEARAAQTICSDNGVHRTYLGFGV
jgi:hypothetical protein